MTIKQINKSPNQLFNRTTLFGLLAVILLSTSCVTNRKFQYLQKGDVNVKEDQFPKDSILRQYDITQFEYRIQPEDVLSIRFRSLTDVEYDFLSTNSGQISGGGQGGGLILSGYLVDQNGSIEFPIIGKIDVSGLTIFEAQNRIQEISRQYLDNPVVDVRLLNFRFTVLGEVSTQGVISSFNNRTSLLEGIGLAGGLRELADRQNIKVIRQSGNKAEVFYVNILEEELVESPVYYLNQNDVIVVAPLKQRPFRNYFTPNLSIVVSSLSFLLLVYGLVFR